MIEYGEEMTDTVINIHGKDAQAAPSATAAWSDKQAIQNQSILEVACVQNALIL